jgi:hypothetical protein
MQKHTAVYGRTSKEYKNVERVSIDQQREDGKAFAVAKKLTGKAIEYLDPDRPQRLPPRQWASGQRKIREGLTNLNRRH